MVFESNVSSNISCSVGPSSKMSSSAIYARKNGKKKVVFKVTSEIEATNNLKAL